MEIKIIKFLQGAGSPFWDGFFKFFSGASSVFMAALTFAIFFIFCNKKFAFVFAGTYGVSIALNTILKFIINRPRPYEFDAEILNKLSSVGQSMPSAHMLTACMISVFVFVYIMLNYKSIWLRIGTAFMLIIYSIISGVSRMYLGQHYISDILIGAILGVAISIASLILFKNTIKYYKKI